MFVRKELKKLKLGVVSHLDFRHFFLFKLTMLSLQCTLQYSTFPLGIPKHAYLSQSGSLQTLPFFIFPILSNFKSQLFLLFFQNRKSFFFLKIHTGISNSENVIFRRILGLLVRCLWRCFFFTHKTP